MTTRKNPYKDTRCGFARRDAQGCKVKGLARILYSIVDREVPILGFFTHRFRKRAEIKAIEEAAQIECEALTMLQDDISKAVVHYMSENNIGFNELVRRSGKSPSQLAKIVKGEANLTMATIAQLYAMMKCKPHIVGKPIKPT
jgi:hypothetical protein